MPYVASGDAQVWWDSTGEGSPIVLINGLNSPSDTWYRLRPLLAAHHRVLTLDNLGTGRTGVPAGPYSMRMLADAVSAVITASGELSVHVVGISLGGMIAQELTLSFPQQVRSLILCATHPGLAHTAADPTVRDALTAAASLPPEERTEALVPFNYAATTPRALIDEDNAVRAANPTDEQGYINQLVGASTWGRLDELSSIAVPTLVLHGKQDVMVPAASSLPLSGSIPGARRVELDACGHQIFTDQTELATRTLLDFVASA